jgi:hypothetical protein
MVHALALAAALLPVLLQAKDNPEFTYWAEHKTGSWVKLKMEMEAQGAKVVVEQKNKVSVNGAAQPEASEKEEIFKDKDKDKNPLTIEKEGDEEIEAGGKKLKCHWIEGTQKDKTKAKFWLHKDIPGGIAKGEASGGELPGKMTMTATSWEKK